jgi:hypothetical protein
MRLAIGCAASSCLLLLTIGTNGLCQEVVRPIEIPKPAPAPPVSPLPIQDALPPLPSPPQVSESLKATPTESASYLTSGSPPKAERERECYVAKQKCDSSCPINYYGGLDATKPTAQLQYRDCLDRACQVEGIEGCKEALAKAVAEIWEEKHREKK